MRWKGDAVTAEDGVAFPPIAKTRRAARPNSNAASKVMVPKAGHGMHSDKAAFYNEVVMAFLQRR